MVVIGGSSDSSSDEEDRRLRPMRTPRVNLASLRVIESSERPEGPAKTPTFNVTQHEKEELIATEAHSSRREDVPTSVPASEHAGSPVQCDAGQDLSNLNFCEDLLAKIIEDVMCAVPQLLASRELEMGLKVLKKSCSRVPDKLTSMLGHRAQKILPNNSFISVNELCENASGVGMLDAPNKPSENGNAVSKDSLAGAVQECVTNENDQVKDALQLNPVL